MALQGEDAAEALRRKRQHFIGMQDAFEDDEKDDTPDPGRLASIGMVVKKAASQRHAGASKDSNVGGLPRSVSDTNLASKDKPPTRQIQVDPGPPGSAVDNNARLPAQLLTRHTFSGTASRVPSTVAAAPTPPTTTRLPGKRKRESVVEQLPQEQQIFTGLRFYFFPNNDTNVARKMRIAKAREFGAEWVKTFDDSVTHVVVDKALNFTQLVKYLKRDDLPQHVIVVSENYPADCISYRALLDPALLQYKVKDQKPPAKDTSSGSTPSLKLKPAGKAVMARQPVTQSSDDRGSSPVRPEHSTRPTTKGASPAPSTSTERVQSSNEFDAIIEQARALQHVPLDDEDESNSRPGSSSGPTPTVDSKHGFDDEASKKRSKILKKQDKFQCMQAHTGGNSNNPNAATIEILDQMSHYYDRTGDDWRTRAYRKAIATLRKHPTKVRTKEEALALPQIGERLATKIEEIAYTNRLRRLDNTKADPNDQILQTFMGIYGVGFAQASRFVAAGYSTLEQLEQRAELTVNQRIGIEHYEDFNSRIPRAEVEKLGAIVRKALLELDPGFEVIVGGSYRRGAANSGDIDCILTHTKADVDSAYIRNIVLDKLVPKLEKEDFLVAALAATSRDDGSKWHGACQLPSADKGAPPNPWRRIDLLLVPPAELGAALIYFTGNDIFNRSLRLLASKHGMRLNQRGLYKDVMRGKGREKMTDGTLVEGRDEKKIFEILGVPWRPAEHRNC